MCNDMVMRDPTQFRLKLKRPRKRLRVPIFRALLLALALVLSWHFVVYGIMRDQYPEVVRINPVTNLALVPYSVEVSSGPISGEGQLISTRTGQRILQGRLRDQARRYLDVYGMIVPWRVKLELQ